MSYNKKDFSNIYPVGEYEFEIENVERIITDNYKSTKLSLQIISPTAFAGRKYTTRVFDEKMGMIVKGVTGKSIDEIFKGGDEISDDDMKKTIDGKFFRAKLGVKNGYNELAQILERKSNENAPATI